MNDIKVEELFDDTWGINKSFVLYRSMRQSQELDRENNWGKGLLYEHSNQSRSNTLLITSFIVTLILIFMPFKNNFCWTKPEKMDLPFLMTKDKYSKDNMIFKIQDLENTKESITTTLIYPIPSDPNMKILLKGIKMYPSNNAATRTWSVS